MTMAPNSGHSDPPSWMEPQLATLTHEPFKEPRDVSRELPA